ncbi:MAG: hypothetical protein O3C63_07520 [Cyanobacteria bacterium]|nr:hypothetical protein [Cyanobacteriota bacterium]MDA1021476.1 hypothetical protein [Cyanobacteriota bacterium]
MPAKKIFISCGELSGESHASRLVIELLKQEPELEIRALGSDILKELGVKLIEDYREYSFSGLTEVVANLSKILGLKKRILKELQEWQPDCVVLVDYGGFNLELAKSIKAEFKNPPKIIEYIAPQIWASRPWRIKAIKASIDKVLCTLPFEEKLYKEANINHIYVGNPVLGSLTRAMPKQDFLKSFAEIQYRKGFSSKTNPTSETILIGLFPGSRKSEIKHMLPLMLAASNQLIERNPKLNFRFILARTSNIKRSLLQRYGLHSKLNLAKDKKPHHIEILDADDMLAANHKLLSAADALWLCSGTVTLEAALYTTPYFLAYKSTLINYLLYLLFRTIKIAGLANIISGKSIAKEFLQYDANLNNFVNETEAWLHNPQQKYNGDFSDYYYKIKSEFSELKTQLSGFDGAKLAAREVLNAC